MACFLAPATTAIVTSSIEKKVPAKYHLNWLNILLWSATLVLVIEHAVRGELIPYPPFLTAAQNPANIPAVLKEILTEGALITAAIIFIWAIMVVVASKIFARRKELAANLTS